MEVEYVLVRVYFIERDVLKEEESEGIMAIDVTKITLLSFKLLDLSS